VPTGQFAADAYNFGKTMTALGVVGTQVYRKVYNGKTYLIFKGRPGMRNVLQGTRYLASNPRIVQMGLGMQGLKHVARGGFVLGMVVSSSIEVADFFFNDEKTMYDLVGGIGVEAVKAGLATLAGLAFGAAAAIVIPVAIVPLAVAAAFAFGAGILLNDLGDTYRVKERVSAALKHAAGNLDSGYYRIQEHALKMLESLSRSRCEASDVASRNAVRLFFRRCA